LSFLKRKNIFQESFSKSTFAQARKKLILRFFVI